MEDFVYLNGSIVPKRQAFVSVDDRGFYFADGIYEVVRYYAGEFFKFDDHLQRLKRSLDAIRISFDSFPDFINIAETLIKKNNLTGKQATVYFQVTRGAYPRKHSFPPDSVKPTVYAFASEFIPPIKEMKDGIKCITLDDFRWHRCDIKSIGLLPNTLSFQKATEENAFECIFLRDGIVTEGSHSNVIGVRNGKVITHPANNLILHGITRKATLELCAKLSIPVMEQTINGGDLFSLDELMVVGTGNEIMPVVKVNEKIIGDGKPGPVTRKLQKEFFTITYKNQLF
jgi:D-alanine transaminase